MALDCLPRPSYSHQCSWRHVDSFPTHKKGEYTMQNELDITRGILKMRPDVVDDPRFQLWFRFIWFGYGLMWFVKTAMDYWTWSRAMLETMTRLAGRIVQ